MRVGTKITILTALALVLSAGGAAAISLRTVHDTYYDVFVPAGDNLVPREKVETACSIDQFKQCNQDVYVPAFYDCGGDDITARIQNGFPSHTPSGATDADTQSILVASTSFYVIPEVTGPGADAVDSIWFEFLETFPVAANEMCSAGSSIGYAETGAYYAFYRGDQDGSDGWKIPINTFNVPDGIYGAVLRAFDADMVPLKTVGIYAIVDNYADDETWAQEGPQGPGNCFDDPNCPYVDTIPPWPSISPGDVALSGQSSIVIEYGERIDKDSLEVLIDGTPVGADDLDFFDSCADGNGVSDLVPVVGTTCDTYGDGITVSVSPQSGMEVSVFAIDTWGNEATKVVQL